MKPARQWSLRRMFFWVLFAALVCSQLSRIYHSTLVGLNEFSLSETQIKELISELDPSARAHAESASSRRSGNEIDMEFNCWISADAATAEQAISHLRKSIIAKADTEGWRITRRGQGGDVSFHFNLSKSASHFRIYCWALPTGKSSYAERLEREGKNVFRIMVLQIGYARP
jgi:hypothetical protein